MFNIKRQHLLKDINCFTHVQYTSFDMFKLILKPEVQIKRSVDGVYVRESRV